MLYILQLLYVAMCLVWMQVYVTVDGEKTSLGGKCEYLKEGKIVLILSISNENESY